MDQSLPPKFVPQMQHGCSFLLPIFFEVGMRLLPGGHPEQLKDPLLILQGVGLMQGAVQCRAHLFVIAGKGCASKQWDAAQHAARRARCKLHLRKTACSRSLKPCGVAFKLCISFARFFCLFLMRTLQNEMQQFEANSCVHKRKLV